jgi:hypothetical protein
MKLPRATRSLRPALGALAVTLLAPLGCARDAAPVREPQPVVEVEPPAVTIPPGLDAAALARLPAALATPALGVVPAESPWLVSFRLGALAAAIDLPGLVARHPSVFESARREVTELTKGVDLVDIANFAKIGVDLERPMGFFAMEAGEGEGGEDMELGFFVSALDPEPLIDFVKGLANEGGMPLAREDVGGASFLYPEDQSFAIFLRDRVLYVIFDWSLSNKGPADVAWALMKSDPSRSLGASPPFLEAVAGLAARDAAFHFRPAPLLEEDAREGDEEAGLTLGALQGFERLAFGLEAEPDRVTLSARPAIPESSVLAALLGASEGPLLAMRVVEPQALARVGVKVDPKASLETALKLLDPGGEGLGGAAKELSDELGVDVANQLLPALTGDFGLTVSGDLRALLASGLSVEDFLGLTFVAGVNDGPAVEKLLPAVAKRAGRDKATWSPSARALTVRTGPGKDARTLTVRVDGGALLVSTNPKAKVAAVAEPHALPRVREACQVPGVSLGGFFEQTLWIAEDAGSFGVERMEAPEASAKEGPEQAALRKAYAKAQVEARALKLKLDEARAVRQIRALKPFGAWALGLRKADGRLSFELGMYLADSTLSQAISGVFALEAEDDAARSSPEQARLSELEGELWELRVRLENAGE